MRSPSRRGLLVDIVKVVEIVKVVKIVKVVAPVPWNARAATGQEGSLLRPAVEPLSPAGHAPADRWLP